MLRTVAYFGHDVSDAAVRRRVEALQADGFSVIGFMKRRGPMAVSDWENVDLGQTRDGAFIQRIVSIFSGAFRGWRAKREVRKADVIVARNLDMLASAVMTRALSSSKAPIIYECLDVHRMLCRNDIVGRGLRKVEAMLMAKTAGLIVSSPAFLTEYFDQYHAQHYRSRLVENRLVPSMLDNLGSEARKQPLAESPKLRIGWVGVLRCSESLNVLCQLAQRFPDMLEIEMHGIPSLVEVPDFHDKICPHNNIKFHGRYKSPEDLRSIYSNMDVVWSLDFMEDGFNSSWLLPNRIYEGGYFGVPSIAYKGTETSRWLEARQSGFVIDNPLLDEATRLVEALLGSPELIVEKKRALAALEKDAFVQPEGFLRRAVLELVA